MPLTVLEDVHCITLSKQLSVLYNIVFGNLINQLRAKKIYWDEKGWQEPDRVSTLRGKTLAFHFWMLSMLFSK